MKRAILLSFEGALCAHLIPLYELVFLADVVEAKTRRPHRKIWTGLFVCRALPLCGVIIEEPNVTVRSLSALHINGATILTEHQKNVIIALGAFEDLRPFVRSG